MSRFLYHSPAPSSFFSSLKCNYFYKIYRRLINWSKKFPQISIPPKASPERHNILIDPVNREATHNAEHVFI